jgi:chemotaxis signal transduction protein
VGEDEFENPPATLQGRMRELIRGAYKLEGNLMLVLDIDKVVDTTCGFVDKDEHGAAPRANRGRSIP